MKTGSKYRLVGWLSVLQMFLATVAAAQMIDNTQAPSTAKAGINKSLLDEIGAGRGSVMTAGSSLYIINRDPSARSGGAASSFSASSPASRAGAKRKRTAWATSTRYCHWCRTADSCAWCHGRPRGSGGTGGRRRHAPDSRDARTSSASGLKEMLADEITSDLRSIRDDLAIATARQQNRAVTDQLASKGIRYGTITANWTVLWTLSRSKASMPICASGLSSPTEGRSRSGNSLWRAAQRDGSGGLGRP